MADRPNRAWLATIHQALRATSSPEIGMHGSVVVTGASTGIGAATARALAGHGFHVFGTVRRHQDGTALEEAGVVPVLMDVTDTKSIERAHAAVVAQLASPDRRREAPSHAADHELDAGALDRPSDRQTNLGRGRGRGRAPSSTRSITLPPRPVAPPSSVAQSRRRCAPHWRGS